MGVCGVYDVPCGNQLFGTSPFMDWGIGGKTLEDETLPKLSSGCERMKDWGI